MRETDVYLVRHGETDYNRLRIVQGHRIDCPLNEEGQRQAELLAARLANVDLAALYSSPLRRAAQTAAIIAASHSGLSVSIEPDLKEMGWGVLEGTPFGPPNEEIFGQMEEEWRSGTFERRVEGGESILDVKSRSVESIKRIVRAHVGERIAVVTHGRLLRIVLATLLEGYRLEAMDDLLHGNTALTHVTWDSGEDAYRVRTLRCDRHLRIAG